MLLRLAARDAAPQHGVDAAALAAATGALDVLMLLAQLFITVLGNVGVLPRTGVPMPLLSWGRAIAKLPRSRRQFVAEMLKNVLGQGAAQ